MTIFFRPCGDLSVAPAPRSKQDEDLFNWLSEKTGIAITQDPDVDYEDWMEPARMLEAALILGHEVHVLPRAGLREAIETPVAVIPGTPTPHMLIGRRINSDDRDGVRLGLAWPDTRTEMAAHYGEMEAFRAHAGRRIRVCDMPGEKAPRSAFSTAHSPESGDAAEAMMAHRGGPCFVKQVLPIKAFENMTFQIPADATLDTCAQILGDRLGFHVAHMEGERDALLVQGLVKMTHETRFFVVGHEIVAAAACIESDTPVPPSDWARAHAKTGFNAIPRPIGDQHILAPRFEVVRNAGTFVSDPGIASDMMFDVDAFIADFMEDLPEMASYVMDVARVAGQTAIIELNPISNAGLYGIQALTFMDAIVHDVIARTPGFDPAKGQPPLDLAALTPARAGRAPSPVTDVFKRMQADAAVFLAEIASRPSDEEDDDLPDDFDM